MAVVHTGHQCEYVGLQVASVSTRRAERVKLAGLGPAGHGLRPHAQNRRNFGSSEEGVLLDGLGVHGDLLREREWGQFQLRA